MNLSTMRARVRNAVKDLDSGAYYFSNDEVDAAIVAALGELTDAAPAVGTKAFNGDGSDRTFDVSAEAGYLYTLAVESPVEADPPVFLGFRENERGKVVTRGAAPASGTSNVKVWYAKAYHSADTIWTTHADDEQTVEIGAAAKLAGAGSRYAGGRLNASLETPRVLRQLAELWTQEYQRKLNAAMVRQVGPQWWTSWRLDREDS